MRNKIFSFSITAATDNLSTLQIHERDVYVNWVLIKNQIDSLAGWDNSLGLYNCFVLSKPFQVQENWKRKYLCANIFWYFLWWVFDSYVMDFLRIFDSLNSHWAKVPMKSWNWAKMAQSSNKIWAKHQKWGCLHKLSPSIDPKFSWLNIFQRIREISF